MPTHVTKITALYNLCKQQCLVQVGGAVVLIIFASREHNFAMSHNPFCLTIPTPTLSLLKLTIQITKRQSVLMKGNKYELAEPKLYVKEQYLTIQSVR